MNITLQYFNDCPNWKVTDDRVHALITEHKIDAKVEYQLIETPEAAEMLQFAGSPTLLVDGRDPFEPKVKMVGLACRVYITESGAAEGPSVAQLKAALGIPL